MEKYLICSYRPPSKVFVASKNRFEKVCSQVSSSISVNHVDETHHGYFWRCMAKQYANGQVPVLGSNALFKYDTRTGTIVQASIVPVKYLIYTAVYRNIDVLLYSKETVISIDSKIVWKSSKYVIAKNRADSNGHIVNFLSKHRILYRLDLKMFIKCMVSDQLNKPELFISKVDSKVVALFQDSDKPERVYYLKQYRGFAELQLCRNRSVLCNTSKAIGTCADLSYCEGYVAVVGYSYDNSLGYKTVSKLIKVSTATNFQLSKSTYYHEKSITYYSIPPKSSLFTLGGVLFLAVQIPRSEQIDLLANRRSCLSLVKSITLSSLSIQPPYNYWLMNCMAAVNVTDRKVCIVVVWRQSVSQIMIVLNN